MCIYANNRSDLFFYSDAHIKSSNKNYKRHLADQKAKYAGRLSWKESSSPARGRRGLLLFFHEQTHLLESRYIFFDLLDDLAVWFQRGLCNTYHCICAVTRQPDPVQHLSHLQVLVL